MTYWLYENWRAHGHRATVHRREGGHCNDGPGQSGGTWTDNGRWLGPHGTADEAAARIRRCGHANVVLRRVRERRAYLLEFGALSGPIIG